MQTVGMRDGGALRIAMLSLHTSPLARLGSRDAGGMNVYVGSLSEQLARAGALVDVFTRRDSPEVAEVRRPFPGVRVAAVPAGPAEPVSRDHLHELLPEISDWIECFARSSGARYDVIHSHYWLSGLAAMELSRRWGAPWVHTSHTLAKIKELHRGPAQEHETELRLRSEDLVLRSADAVVVANEVERREVVREYGVDPARLHIVPCGVDACSFRPDATDAARERLGLAPHERIVLYVGRLEPLKGVDVLLRAASALRHRVPDLRVLIVGGSQDAEDPATAAELRRLRAIVGEEGIGEVVEFLGPMPHEWLPDLYRAADVCAVPSYYESCGLTALEALACGTPVVASRTGGLSVTVSDGVNGYLVRPGDHRELAARLGDVLRGDGLGDGHAAELGRARSWQRTAAATLEVYRRVLSPAGVC